MLKKGGGGVIRDRGAYYRIYSTYYKGKILKVQVIKFDKFILENEKRTFFGQKRTFLAEKNPPIFSNKINKKKKPKSVRIF